MPCESATPLRLAALLFTALVAACKPANSTAVSESAASPASPSSSTAAAAHVWVPYVVEKQMGAQWCPQGTADEQIPDARVRSNGLLNQPCFGLMPQELARVLLAIPDKDIFLSNETRTEQTLQPQPYLALPGKEGRPDLMASVDLLEGITLRSFEGTSAADTVYIVQGPFRCIDNEPQAPREGEYLVETALCKSAQAETRLYKWASPGVLNDVTQQYLTPPQLTAAEQAAIEPGTLQLDLTRLSQIPVMRWTAQLKNRNPDAGHDSYAPIAMPATIPTDRRLGDALHFGFVAWDGARFQTQQRAPRVLWPIPYCDPARPNPRCTDSRKTADRYADPFVDEQSAPSLH